MSSSASFAASTTSTVRSVLSRMIGFNQRTSRNRSALYASPVAGSSAWRTAAQAISRDAEPGRIGRPST